MTTAAIEREGLRRIVASLVTAEINRSRGAGAGALEDLTAWHDDRPLSVGSVPLDSLETVHAGAALYEMFGHAAVEPERPRTSPATVGQWLDRIAAMPGGEDSCLTVMTSGSTGRPKPCVHPIRELHAEAAYFAAMLPSTKRVIALVPAHHIYGLIWTALLPSAIGVPVVIASATALPRLLEGDLIVAVPDQWRALSRSIDSWPVGVCGVSAGAPLDAALADDLLAAGLGRMCDIYGSSETGGIAVREAPAVAYTLLPRWRFASPVDADVTLIVDRHGGEVALPDRLAIAADLRFTMLGRRDGAVQVGGVNVWPEDVAAQLRRCPGVAEIAVRLGDHHRLKAFVVPETAIDQSDLLDRLRKHAQRLALPEQRPTAYVFGSALPRTALGKVSDWS